MEASVRSTRMYQLLGIRAVEGTKRSAEPGWIWDWQRSSSRREIEHLKAPLAVKKVTLLCRSSGIYVNLTHSEAE